MSSAEQPIEGRWYWVKLKTPRVLPSGASDWFPALRDPRADGGWTNLDTWSDLHGDVVDWRLIDPPSPE